MAANHSKKTTGEILNFADIGPRFVIRNLRGRTRMKDLALTRRVIQRVVKDLALTRRVIQKVVKDLALTRRGHPESSEGSCSNLGTLDQFFRQSSFDKLRTGWAA